MKKRNPLLVSFLSVITLGIYYSYWLYCMWQEVNNKGLKVPPPYLALMLHLLAVLYITVLISPITDNWNILENSTSILLILLLIGSLAVVSLSLWFYKFCAAMKKLTKNETIEIFDYPIVLTFHYFLLFFIWAGIAQYKINKSNLFS